MALSGLCLPSRQLSHGFTPNSSGRKACLPSTTSRSSAAVKAVLQQPRPSTSKQPDERSATGSLPMNPALDFINVAAKLQEAQSLQSDAKGAQPVRPNESRRTDTVWHFAYGANMNFYTLARRGVRVLNRESAFVRDERVHMIFRHRGGYATLARMKEGEVPRLQRYTRHAHGVLYELTKEDMKGLAEFEGGYNLADFEVETYDGRVVMAKAFVSSPMATLPQEVAPTERYMMVLRDGAGDNYLEPLHQAWLSAIPTVPSAGLPAHYYDTPAKYLAYGFVASCACILLSFHIQLPHI